MKVAWELNKIFSTAISQSTTDAAATAAAESSGGDIKVSVTAVRVPTLRAHAEAVSIESKRPCPVKQVRSVSLL